MGILYSNSYKQDLFNYTCALGEFVKAQKLYESGNINIHNLFEYPFTEACANGHLNIAKWLYYLDYIDIHVLDDKAFYLSFKNGHEEVTRWLYSLDKYNYDHGIWTPIVKKLNN